MITLFSSPACSHCNDFIKELKENNIEYEYKNIDEPDIYNEVVAVLGTSKNTELPVVVTNSGKVLNRPELKDLI